MVSRRLRHYEILHKIGVGGMATVYQARDTRGGAIVAIKVMHPHLAENQQFPLSAIWPVVKLRKDDALLFPETFSAHHS